VDEKTHAFVDVSNDATSDIAVLTDAGRALSSGGIHQLRGTLERFAALAGQPAAYRRGTISSIGRNWPRDMTQQNSKQDDMTRGDRPAGTQEAAARHRGATMTEPTAS
jgi:hypothetical protein